MAFTYSNALWKPYRRAIISLCVAVFLCVGLLTLRFGQSGSVLQLGEPGIAQEATHQPHIKVGQMLSGHESSTMDSATSTVATALLTLSSPGNEPVSPVLNVVESRPISPLDFTLPDLYAMPQDAIITYIPYTFGFPMLLQVLQVYHRAGWQNIVVIDNSWNKDAFNRERELRDKYNVLKVVLTTSHLQFAGLMATIDTLAASSGHDKYLWGHSDVFTIFEDPAPYELVKGCVREAWENDAKLGILFMDYDLLSAVKVEAAQKAPWDPTMPQYGSDCDRYTRIRLAGYTTPEAQTVCSLPQATLFNMNTVLSPSEIDIVLSDSSYEKRLQVIRIANSKAKFHAWRLQGDVSSQGRIDKEIIDTHTRAGGVYFMNKWAGKKAGFGKPCNLREEDRPNFDIPIIPLFSAMNISEILP